MDWTSFVMGMSLMGGIFLVVDLIRSKRNLRDARLEIADLRKKAKKKQDSKKTKKPKDD